MNQLKFQQRIFYLLGVFAAQVEASNAASLLDVNKIAEDVLIPVFSEIFDLQELVNLNVESENYEGIDLGDRKTRVAFQITSTTDNKKIKKTLSSVVEKKYYKDYDRFIIYDLTTKQSSYSGGGWCEIVGGKFNENKSKIIGGKFAFAKSDIIDYRDLSASINRLSLEKIQKIAGILENQFGETAKAGRILEPDFAELIEACWRVTAAAIKQTLYGRQIIRRESFRVGAEKFLNSAVRYLFVTGASAVGKSTVLASEAEAMQANGWTTLMFRLLPEKGFSLEYAKEEIRKKFSPPLDRLEWEQVITPWSDTKANNVETNGEGLIIILDGLEVAEPSHIAAQMSLLHQSLIPTSPAQVKVIISCRNTEFESYLRQKLLPLYNRTTDLENNSLLDYVVFEIKDFTNLELDAALAKIGVADSLREWNAKGEFNSHAAALRGLLKHPGTFEHYADLFARDRLNLIQGETWSSLIEKRLEICLKEVERETGIKKETIKDNLIELAKNCRAEKARDFALDLSEVRTKFPDWFDKESLAPIGIYTALIKSGILEERTGFQEQKLTAFKITDAGAYYLSFALESEFETISSSNSGDAESKIVSSWLDEGWLYSPVRDALLALIDRLSVAPTERRKKLLPLLDVIISTHDNNLLFQLMKPSVLEFIFKLIKRENDAGGYYRDYFEPARNVRYSAENEELLRRNFTDLNSIARELAVELTGIYGLAHFIPQLVKLLRDEEKDEEEKEENYVRSAVFKTCGRIGVPAILPLVEALNDPKADDELKRLILVALVCVGHLNERVSESLSAEFERILMSEDVESLKRLLLAAAHLRDRRQVAYVLQTLNHEDDDVIWKAAKFFTEVPDERAFEPLRKILSSIDFSDSETVWGRWHLEQVIAALIKIDREKIIPELLKIFEKALESYENDPNGKHTFSPSRIAELGEKYELADCYPMLFEHLLEILQKSQMGGGVFHLTEEIGEIWNPASLEKLISARQAAEDKGTDVARIFVEAVLPHNQEDQDIYGDRLNQVSHLHPAIKSGASNFTAEAGRLLMKAPYSSTKKLCQYFWIMGDEIAEDYLLYKFDEVTTANETAESSHKKYLVSDISRALGTCGTEKAAQKILAFLAESAEGVTINFPTECLLPMLIRKTIAPSALSEIAANENNNWVGRAVCVEALARYDAPEHLDLFLQLARKADGHNTILRDAVIALGVTRSPRAVKPLREVLRQPNAAAQIKGYAARALSLALDARDALPDIEEAFLELKNYDQITVKLFVNALTHFGESSSMRVLKTLDEAPPDVRRYISEALGTFAKEADENEKEVVQKLEETAGDRFGFFDEQNYLVRGMLKAPRNKMLTLLSEHLEKDRLTESSRWQISNFLRSLANDPSLDKQLIVKIAARLVCDTNPGLRYNVLSILSFLDDKLCRDIYEFLMADPAADEWTRVCAVESLGYWESDENDLRKTRYDKDILVARAADLALKHRKKREKLKFHFERFECGNGLARLASFICLLKHGDRETIRLLAQKSDDEISLEKIYAAHLRNKISERLEREESDLRREQEKRLKERGTIWFD